MTTGTQQITILMAAKNTSMPKPERKGVILGYLAENDVLLPTGLVHTNLLEYRQITFSEKTTKRMLYEMRDDGLVEVVDRGGLRPLPNHGRRSRVVAGT